MADATSPGAPLRLPGQIQREARQMPLWAPLVRRAEGAVGLIPAYRDTKKGRSNARQLRLGLLGLGLLVLVFGGDWWIVVGALLMIAGLVVPAPELRKRTWVTRLRSARKPRRSWQGAPVVVELDDRRLSVLEDGKRLRRVLVDRGEHGLRTASLTIDGAAFTALGVTPASGRKAETIWLYTDATATDGAPGAADDTVDRGSIDLLVRLEPRDFERLREQL